MKVAIVNTLKQYCKTTTLHGLKYLCSPYYIDRIIWLVWCCATAGCAGVLCAVLWSRFLQTPALLTVRDPEEATFPTILICPTPERIAMLFTEKLSIKAADLKFVSLLILVILKRKIPDVEALIKLDRILVENNVSLIEGLNNSMPACRQILKRCRWHNIEFDCNLLFKKRITEWGMCCSMNPLRKPQSIINQKHNTLERSQSVNLVLDCYNERLPQACQFIWAFKREPLHQPIKLSSNEQYIGKIQFTSIINKDHNELIEGSCLDDDDYSRARCLTICKENQCGCASPFRSSLYGESHLPTCAAVKLHCILQFNEENNTCNCANPCDMIRSEIAFERSTLSSNHFAFDPLYSNLNMTRSIIVSVVVRAGSSRLLYSKPMETLITLMSSLGGVFNMFLGVGFFSALEVLFFLIIKLPVTIRRYTEIKPGS